MTFETQEESLEGGRPVELFEFTIGLTVFRFTSTESVINDGVNDFQPVPITRSQPKVNQDEPGSSVVIQMPTNENNTRDFARAWVQRAPTTGDTRVRIFRHHTNDTGFQLFWIGYLVAVNYENNGFLTNVQCKSLDNMFTLQGPRRNWGPLCQHQLYDSGCTLNEVTYTVSGAITAIAADGVTITVPGLAAAVVTRLGGELRIPGTLSTALIVAVSGDDYTIQYPDPDFEVGITVELVEGCDHSTDNMTGCAAFPNGAEPSGTNVENFGGTPYTPPINLFTKGGDAL
jgi:hypothetical protein